MHTQPPSSVWDWRSFILSGKWHLDVLLQELLPKMWDYSVREPYRCRSYKKELGRKHGQLLKPVFWDHAIIRFMGTEKIYPGQFQDRGL